MNAVVGDRGILRVLPTDEGRAGRRTDRGCCVELGAKCSLPRDPVNVGGVTGSPLGFPPHEGLLWRQGVAVTPEGSKVELVAVNNDEIRFGGPVLCDSAGRRGAGQGYPGSGGRSLEKAASFHFALGIMGQGAGWQRLQTFQRIIWLQLIRNGFYQGCEIQLGLSRSKESRGLEIRLENEFSKFVDQIGVVE